MRLQPVLHYFFISGFLHRDGDLRQVLELCCNVLPPQDQAEVALRLLQGSERGRVNIPSASAISRARFEVDVGWTLIFRQVLTEFLNGGGVRLYVQTDANSQAVKQYQITILNVVKTVDLAAMHRDLIAWLLADLRPL